MLLLWLWMTLPPLSMLHYATTTPPALHYLLVMLPGAFVVAALGVGWLLDRVARLASQEFEPEPRDRHQLLGRAGWLALVAALALLMGGQTLESAFYAGSLAAGRFEAYHFYGYPLAEMQVADTQLGVLQRQQGAGAIFVVRPAAARFAVGVEYLLVGEHVDRTGLDPTCLVLPAPTAGPALEAVTAPDTSAGALLASLPNSQRVAQIALAGGAPWPVYRVAGQTPALSDEHAVAPVTFANAAGEGLRLAAVAQPAPGLLRLRWEVLGYSPTSADQPELSVAAEPPGANVTLASGLPLANATLCQPTRLRAGETLFTWVQLPPSTSSSTSTVGASATAITVADGAIAFDLPSFGPLRLLADRPTGAPLATLKPSAPAAPAAPRGQVSGSAFIVPLS